MKIKMIARGFTAIAALGLMGLASQQAMADFSTSNPTVTQVNSTTYLWSYDISLTSGETATSASPADQFTLYDIGGFVPGSATFSGAYASNFAAPVEEFTSPAPVIATSGPLNPVDSAQFYNVRVVATADTANPPAGGTQSLTVGTLSFDSTEGPANTGFLSFAYTARNSNNSAIVDGGIKTVMGPAAVPEPSSVAAFAFTGMGIMGLMLFARKRRSSMTA